MLTKIIGISGCTNSGKTTLTEQLVLNIPNSISIIQDDFYFLLNSGKLEYLQDLQSFNFDTPEAIDFEKLIDNVQVLKDSGKNEFIFVDGSLIYWNDRLCKLFDQKYFLRLVKEECHSRRLKRKYESLDTPNYFEKCVWSEYLKYEQFCFTRYHDIVYIDGSRLQKDIYDFICNEQTKNKKKNLV